VEGAREEDGRGRRIVEEAGPCQVLFEIKREGERSKERPGKERLIVMGETDPEGSVFLPRVILEGISSKLGVRTTSARK